MAMGIHRVIRGVSAFSLGLACVAAATFASVSHAQFGGGFGGRSVGGVMIDSAGIVRTATVAERQELANLLRTVIAAPQGKMGEAAGLRMISLKRIQQAIAENQHTGQPIPESISFLAGLQRVEYVFVDQENHDIILAGPAEPWTLRDDGSVVGTVTGGAVIQLDDLMVAMRSVESARQGGITCSIEPTDEGRRRLQQLLSKIKLTPGQNPVVYEEAMREAYGPQMIHLTGVPADSHFARILVAADYEMKRIAMGLVQAPIKELPSYLHMSKNARHSTNQNPRWWMACNYESLRKSEDGMAWQLAGQGVKTETEQDVIAADGSVQGADKPDKIASAWANQMTAHYSKLSQEMPVFANLRNVIDLTVVATLITQERLDQIAGIDLSLLRDENEIIQPAAYPQPKAVEPQCSFVRGRSGWVVTASGGVDINGFQVVENQTLDVSLAQTRSAAMPTEEQTTWWWDLP